MRFVSPRDYNTIVRINTELINDVVDTTVNVFKMHQQLTKTNSYNEAPKKTWYEGITIPCLIERKQNVTVEDEGNIDVTQEANFFFLRQECANRNIYPEIGDIIQFDSQYYEIHNTSEVYRWGGQVLNNLTIIANCHLSRITRLQLDSPLL